MSEQRDVRLGDVADVNWGDTKVTKASYVADGFQAYSASGPDGRLPWADYDRVGVVVSAIGAECGKSWLAKGQWSCIKNTLRFFSTDASVDTEFLYWATRDPSVWPRRGSAQPFISQGDARNIRLRVPPFAEQRAIAGVLGALDDKIESNRRIAAAAQALARLEFDAVLQSGQSQSGRLSDVATLRYGKALAEKVRRPGPVPVYGSSGVTGTHDTPLVAGPVIVLGRKGRPGTVYLSFDDCWPIDTTFWLEPRQPVSLAWLYMAVEQMDLGRFGADSAVPGLNREMAEADGLLVPDPVVQRSIQDRAWPLLERWRRAGEESMRLASLRDALLPELLSGRLRVRDGEQLLSEAL